MSVIPWEDIRRVVQSITQYKSYGVTTNTQYSYTISLADNRQFSFTNMQRDVSDLGSRIQKATFPLLLARSVAAYNAGEPIQFGPLTVSQSGIATKNKTIAWNDISGVKLSNGQLLIRQQGRWLTWASIAVNVTPNVFVLIALIEHIISTRGTK